ncbi:MAG: hypothetical protein R3B13_20170 [Polyangiaceae bacterium]
MQRRVLLSMFSLALAATQACGSDGDSGGGSSGSSGSAGSGASATGGSAGSTGGNSGSGGSSGSTGGSAGSDASATGGSAGSSGGSAGTDAGPGDAATDATDAMVDAGNCSVGNACCAGNTCNDGSNCLGQVCSCIKDIDGNYVLRTDGKVLRVSSNVAQQIVDESGTFGADLTGITQVVAGQSHACARKNDGTVWCWAHNANGNASGQLGNGALNGAFIQLEATQVRTGPGPTYLTGVKALSLGSTRCYLESTNCALKTDGSVWCWGEATDGKLVDGTATASPYAQQLKDVSANPITGAEQVTVGTRHACYLKAGKVYCWGANVGGALGQGNQTASAYPLEVTLPGAAQQVGAGPDLTCARVSDKIYCWGHNNGGAVGIGEPSANTDGCINFCKLTPRAVLTAVNTELTGATDLHVNYQTVCTTRTDGSLWCWGSGVGNMAAAFQLSAQNVTQVALHNSCGSGSLASSLRVVHQNGDYRISTLPPFAVNCQ